MLAISIAPKNCFSRLSNMCKYIYFTLYFLMLHGMCWVNDEMFTLTFTREQGKC